MMRRAALLGTLLLLAGGWWVVSAGSDGSLTLTALDVGQGDAILVRTPNGTDILVDTGRDRAVVDELGAVLPPGDRTLELLVLTHPDADHIGGTPFVLAHYRVDRAWVSGATSDTATDRAVASGLREHGITPEPVLAGPAVQITDGTTLEVLWPNVPPGRIPPGRAGNPNGGTNDTSVVIRVTYRGFCAMLAGDASEAVEAELLRAGTVGPCAVLKVGHHGSRYSSSDAFLAALRPRFALISVGAKNTYGHPAPAALRRLERTGAAVLRTDLQGRLTVRYDGAYHALAERALPLTNR